MIECEMKMADPDAEFNEASLVEWNTSELHHNCHQSYTMLFFNKPNYVFTASVIVYPVVFLIQLWMTSVSYRYFISSFGSHFLIAIHSYVLRCYQYMQDMEEYRRSIIAIVACKKHNVV